MSRGVTLELPGVPPLPVTAEIAERLGQALRDYHRAAVPPRDYAAEIAAYLVGHPDSSTVEIARGIRARDAEVRGVLNADGRFTHALRASGGAGRALSWKIAACASEAVPGVGTGSSDEANR